MASFGGSARLDERRRRRLAQENGESSVDESLSEATSVKRRRLDVADVRTCRRQVLLPLPAFIPSRAWRLVGLAVLAVLPGFVGWAYADEITSWAAHAGPGLERLSAGAPLPFSRWYECLLIGAAAHLAALIFWVRSRSHHDFSGRYWIWARFAVLCLVFATARATGAHVALGETLQFFIRWSFWRQQTVWWLAPAAVAGGTLLWRLQREMRGCRGSWMCLVVAGIAYWLAGLGCLDVLGSVGGLTQGRIIDASLLSGHGWLLLGLLLHARHVVHRTAEPAPIPERTSAPRPHFLALFRRRGTDAPEPDTAQSKRGTKSKSRRRKPSRKAGGPVADDKADADATSTEPSEAEEDMPDEADRSTTDPIAPRKPHFNVTEIRPAELRAAAPSPAAQVDDADADEDDGDHDDDESLQDRPELRGLSRKQRRKMLKQLRARR